MNAETSDLKELLMRTDEEFHNLAEKHHQLEDRLTELTTKHYLSAPEQLEEVTLKKRKLQLKDRMEDILRRHRQGPGRAQARGRFRLDRAGLPFIGGALALALILGATVSWTVAIPLVALGLVFVYFFRDPDRTPPAPADHVLAPADGRVLFAGSASADGAPPGAWQQIS